MRDEPGRGERHVAGDDDDWLARRFERRDDPAQWMLGSRRLEDHPGVEIWELGVGLGDDPGLEAGRASRGDRVGDKGLASEQRRGLAAAEPGPGSTSEHRRD